MTTGYLPMDDGKLYYEMSEGGAGKATLVLSHALFLDSRMWDDQWAAFSQAFRVVRYDMRGNGRSDVATGPRCRREDLYQLLRHLEIEQAHLLGCSVGGEISIDLALEHPAIWPWNIRHWCSRLCWSTAPSAALRCRDRRPRPLWR